MATVAKEFATLDSILRKPVVLDSTGLSNSGLYALIKRGQFPRPLKLSASGRASGCQAAV